MQRATEAVAAVGRGTRGQPAWSSYMGEVGGNTSGGLSGVDNKDCRPLGSIAIELIDGDLRPIQLRLRAALQDEVRQLPLTETVSFRGFRGGPGGEMPSTCRSSAPTPGATAQGGRNQPPDPAWRFPSLGPAGQHGYDREEPSLSLTPQGGRGLRDRRAGPCCATASAGSSGDLSDGAAHGVDPRGTVAGELTGDFLDGRSCARLRGNMLPLADS